MNNWLNLIQSLSKLITHPLMPNDLSTNQSFSALNRFDNGICQCIKSIARPEFSCCRYSGSTLKVRCTAELFFTHMAVQSKCTISHLDGLKAIESAYWMPFNHVRYSGQINALPA